MKQKSLADKINIRLAMFVALIMAISSVYIYFQVEGAKESVYGNFDTSLSKQIKSKTMAKGKICMATAVALANSPIVTNALKENKRDLLIVNLKKITDDYKKGTPFKKMKIHVHTKDVKSFVRSWKPKKFGDDLSSFRATINKVKSTHKPMFAVEVGRAGLVIRGLSPIFDESNNYLGSVEVIQSFNSIVKLLKKQKTEILILLDEKFKRGNALTSNNKVQNYYLSQSDVVSHLVDVVNNIDMKELKQNGHMVTKGHLLVSSNIKDINNNNIGIAILAKHIEDINGAVESVENIVYSTGVLILVIALMMMFIVNYLVKSTLIKELELFNHGLDHFLDFVSFKTNRFKPIKIETNDELGRLLQRLNDIAVAQNKLLQADMQVMGEITITSDKVEQGIYKCRIKAKTQNPMIQTLAITINKMVDAIDRDMSQLKKVVEEYANDDFRNNIKANPRVKADMLAVVTSVNQLGVALSKGAKVNLDNGHNLEHHSDTMSNSVRNLVEKAELQSKSLRETSDAVEFITKITKENTENTTKMAHLGQKVQSAVANGLKLASQTSSAMDSINEQVNAIADSISVIDQISFQTNILSLNAAVEAATAGEAGKGFAVVAQEVRNLASRSADAANDIKNLVDSATVKANEGKSVSDDMITGYKILNENTTETIDIIKSVSDASNEQIKGMEQINNTIVLLDKATKENSEEANQVSHIASDVNVVASNLLADASSKKFN